MTIKKNFIFFIAIIFFSVSCASAVKISAEDERYPKIIAEKAYTEFNNRKYKSAIAYYQYIVDNFSRDSYAKEVAWAYYEIGFCYYYQNKYKEALDYLNIVVNDFTALPPKILAQIVMQDIYDKKPKLKPIELIDETMTIEENIDVES